MPDNINLDYRGTSSVLNDPSLPSTAPTNVQKLVKESDKINPRPKTFMERIYNRETKEYCGRTCISWLKIIAYGFIYLLFLCTYTLMFLYGSLLLIRRGSYKHLEPSQLVYPVQSIGLTAIPTSESSIPLIWYRRGEKSDFEKYVKAIDRLLISNSEGQTVNNLGPCGRPPYGYGDNPCVIIKVNKHFHWSGKPLQINSTVANKVSPRVMKWVMFDKSKHWLECSGYHSYDREHIGSIKYYPDPPGFDLDLFPLHKNTRSPLIAIQISNFTIGVSLAIQCKLWYESGPSVVDFVLYVAANDSIAFSGQAYH